MPLLPLRRPSRTFDLSSEVKALYQIFQKTEPESNDSDMPAVVDINDDNNEGAQARLYTRSESPTRTSILYSHHPASHSDTSLSSSSTHPTLSSGSLSTPHTPSFTLHDPPSPPPIPDTYVSAFRDHLHHDLPYTGLEPLLTRTLLCPIPSLSTAKHKHPRRPDTPYLRSDVLVITRSSSYPPSRPNSWYEERNARPHSSPDIQMTHITPSFLELDALDPIMTTQAQIIPHVPSPISEEEEEDSEEERETHSNDQVPASETLPADLDSPPISSPSESETPAVNKTESNDPDSISHPSLPKRPIFASINPDTDSSPGPSLPRSRFILSSPPQALLALSPPLTNSSQPQEPPARSETPLQELPTLPPQRPTSWFFKIPKMQSFTFAVSSTSSVSTSTSTSTLLPPPSLSSSPTRSSSLSASVSSNAASKPHSKPGSPQPKSASVPTYTPFSPHSPFLSQSFLSRY